MEIKTIYVSNLEIKSKFRSLINKCQLIFGGPELTLEKKVVKFIEESSYTIHGIFPFGLANNLDVNFERVFIVDRKIR